MAVVMLGIPYDEHSSHMRGCALGPAAIRSALASGSANWCNESGEDLDPTNPDVGWQDLGDINGLEGPVEGVLDAIRSRVRTALGAGDRVLSVGGDHLITWPVIAAHREIHDQLTILHFDAHPDTYDELDGDRYSHACPFARIMENELADRLVQVGIRTMTPHQAEQTERFGAEVVPAAGWDGTLPELNGPVYISFDLDALDPAHAPGVSHH